MSIGTYRSTINRLQREQADVQKRVATETGKGNRLRADGARLRADALRTTSHSVRDSKIRQAESKERDLERSLGALADLAAKKTRIDEALARAVDGLRKAEDSDNRQRETREKRRRDDEMRHQRDLTREAERQARALSSIPTGTLTIDFAALPEEITVLFVAANPQDTDRLALDEEVREVKRNLRLSDLRESIRLESEWATRTTDLLQILNEHKPHIVHFSGHGNETEIAFANDEGTTTYLRSEVIGQLLRSVSDNIRLVVFNSCDSEDHATEISHHVEAAVGMAGEVDDVAARVFAGQLYSAIGFGRSLRQAFDQACAQLAAAGLSDKAAPKLHVRADLSADEIVLVRP